MSYLFIRYAIENVFHLYKSCLLKLREIAPKLQVNMIYTNEEDFQLCNHKHIGYS